MRKEKWEKPKLIVLTRGKPEEMLLTTCKASTDIGSSASASQTPCSDGYCADCSTIAAS